VEGVGLTVGSQHWIGVEGSSHPCTKGHHPKLGFFHLKAPHVNYCALCNIVYYCIHFSPLQVKNKPCEGVSKSAFILGPVSMVVNR
jgi:hypothetical protein